MRFEPKTEKEIADSKLLKAGIYNFEVTKASDDTSNAGNDMIVLELDVWNGNGERRSLTDYLVSKRIEKLRHAAVACGLVACYENGEMTSVDFLGKTGRLKLVVEKGKKSATGGKWPDRNVIDDYLTEELAN
jgi:hypothetical protein